MLNEIKKILADGDEFSQRLYDVASQYIFFLSLYIKDHTFEAASDLMGLDASRYSAFLNDQECLNRSEQLLNRAMRRYLRKFKLDGRIAIIIDSTLWKRNGRGIENRGKYNHGKGSIYGHKFINIVVIVDGKIVPLLSIPHLCKEYCEANGLNYRTENEIVVDWVNSLPTLNLFTEDQIKSILFLMDSGYDCKEVQRSILNIGCHFVVALKINRNIHNTNVTEYFKDHRHLSGESIRLTVGNGGKNSRRTYSVRLARSVKLKGVGLVNVACSKKENGKKKYLASSDQSLSAREIVLWYSKRWAIETWHREVKQNFGFTDCRAGRFSAICAHINFVLVSYIWKKESGSKVQTAQEYLKIRSLDEVRIELTKFGGVEKAKSLVDAALQRNAA